MSILKNIAKFLTTNTQSLDMTGCCAETVVTVRVGVLEDVLCEKK